MSCMLMTSITYRTPYCTRYASLTLATRRLRKLLLVSEHQSSSHTESTRTVCIMSVITLPPAQLHRPNRTIGPET